MHVEYQRISKSWVARHPDPVGIVEFYGGQLYGQFPTVTYDYFLASLYKSGYTVIAVPHQMGLNHARIAKTLLEERDEVYDAIPELQNLPHFWVGHSVGCKYIALLEAYTEPETNRFVIPGLTETEQPRAGILNQPSLLIAPDISDTADSIPVPLVPSLLDMLNLGIRPSRTQTQNIIEQKDLFTLTGILSFKDDDIAGNASESPEKSDVAWFIKTLEEKVNNKNRALLHTEIDGEHLEPIGVKIGHTVFNIELSLDLIKSVPRELEPIVLDLLGKLGKLVKPGDSLLKGVRIAQPASANGHEVKKPAPVSQPAPVSAIPIQSKAAEKVSPENVVPEAPAPRPVEIRPEPISVIPEKQPAAAPKAEPVKTAAVQALVEEDEVAVLEAEPETDTKAQITADSPSAQPAQQKETVQPSVNHYNSNTGKNKKKKKHR